MIWPFRRKPAPPPEPAPSDPHGPILALARAVLDCRSGFGEMPFSVALSPHGGGSVGLAVGLPCGYILSHSFRVIYDMPWMVPTAMGLLLVRAQQHMKACPDGPLDIGPFELTTKGK